MAWLSRGAVAVAITLAACSSVQTVRVQSESVYVGPHMRPIAVVHAQVTSAYLFFIPIPGEVDLDHVVNRMLVAAAKTLGADRVVDIKVEITPDDGIWVLRKLIGWRSAEASGVAVVVEDEPPAAPPAAAGAEPRPDPFSSKK
ncbi:MAG TPA: hypothetical protein VLX92_14595 [Kofleriaceae bacterium]|nr:hypothetical protein [Kofleriaceae bacterium]